MFGMYIKVFSLTRKCWTNIKLLENSTVPSRADSLTGHYKDLPWKKQKKRKTKYHLDAIQKRQPGINHSCEEHHLAGKRKTCPSRLVHARSSSSNSQSLSLTLNLNCGVAQWNREAIQRDACWVRRGSDDTSHSKCFHVNKPNPQQSRAGMQSSMHMLHSRRCIKSWVLNQERLPTPQELHKRSGDDGNDMPP